MGNGYWIHFENEGTTQLSGTPINEMTLQLNAGWNLISGISSVIGLSGISDPENIVVPGTIFEFTDSYDYATLLTPGHGYWVYASTDGNITISSGNSSRINAFNPENLGKVNKLSLDGYELYFGVSISEKEMVSYQLPPKPPVGAFDVRFKGDTRITMEKAEIKVMNAYETLTIKYAVIIDTGKDMNWVLTSDNGKDYLFEGTGWITVPSAERFTLELKAVMPAIFILHQNFPNPFNPITTLRYDLPERAMVTLTIYDLMGRNVTQLVNSTKEAGYRSVQWDATDSYGNPVSAGVYICQIHIGDPSLGSGHGIVQTRKMVILK